LQVYDRKSKKRNGFLQAPPDGGFRRAAFH
jgi:hypothetical protein